MTTKELISIIQLIARKTKTDAYLVGGYVRDKLLGVETKDIDIVVVGDAKTFVKNLEEKFNSKCLFHEKFGTYIFDIKNGFRIDVATARAESYRSPAALPTVKLGVSLKKDLARRDFTINALAMKLDGGDVIDFYGGLNDLKAKKIRALHQKSFIDDPTRIIRAVRFANRFNFSIESQTLKYIRDARAAGCIEKLSPSRRGRELIAILSEKKVKEIFQHLERLKVLKLFFPEINIKKIGIFPPADFLNKLKTLLKATDDPQKFLTKYQFPRKIKSSIF